MDEGDASPLVGRLWAGMPKALAEANLADTISATDVLPEGEGYVTYSGSLTTPPCTEGVRWFVMKDRVTWSAEQLAVFKKAIGPNALPTMALNDRDIAAY